MPNIHRKNKKQKAEVEEIKKEIEGNDKVYKRSKEQLDVVIHVALINGKILREDSPFYTNIMENLKFGLVELALQVNSGFRVISPTFEFQRNIEWQKMQTDVHSKKMEEDKKLLAKLEQSVSEIKNEIISQQARWIDRRKLLIGRLKELKEDVSAFETPSYIG